MVVESIVLRTAEPQLPAICEWNMVASQLFAFEAVIKPKLSVIVQKAWLL